MRQYGYEAPDQAAGEDITNIEEDLVDAGWHFPVPAAELAAQLRDLNERANRYYFLSPERSFWLDRPSSINEETADYDWDADSDNSG